MRQRHLNERGSSQWPFVITLVILLVFVYMWFSEKDKRDVAETDRAKSQEEYANLSKATTDVLNYFRDVSAKVGWASKSLNDVVQDPNAKEVLNRLAGSGGAFVTDVAQVDKQITRDGTTEGGKPGLYNYLINDSDISIRADLRTRGAEGVKETNVSFEWMTPEFRQKLKEIAQIPVPVPPKPPADADDEAAQAKYQSEQKTYEADVKKINDGMAELQTMGEQWKKYEEIIKGPRPFDPDTQRVVKLLMFTPEASGTMDLATLVTLPPKVVDNYKSEFRANKEEDTAVIDRVQADNQSKETTITNGQNELKAEQQRHVQEVDQLRGELTQANQTADTNRQEATKALNDLQHEKELHSNEVAQLNSQKNALENRVRLNKEVTDLEIRRNDPDGRVLASSPTMGTAIIDLGTQARVTPGTRFEVSRIGKGGIRSVKGQIQVIQVLGPTRLEGLDPLAGEPPEPDRGGRPDREPLLQRDQAHPRLLRGRAREPSARGRGVAPRHDECRGGQGGRRGHRLHRRPQLDDRSAAEGRGRGRRGGAAAGGREVADREGREPGARVRRQGHHRAPARRVPRPLTDRPGRTTSGPATPSPGPLRFRRGAARGAVPLGGARGRPAPSTPRSAWPSTGPRSRALANPTRSLSLVLGRALS